jgi:hypothetical protein
MASIYIGPVAVYRRFLAGLSVTPDNVRDDDSLWVAEKSQRFQLARMGAMIEPPEGYA